MDLDELRDRLDDATKGLRGVEHRRMFGCEARFTGNGIFALVWKHGRIALRLPETTDYEELLSVPGAGPWKAGKMVMSHWVLVPPAFHDDRALLAPWVRRAHQLTGLARAAKAKSKSASATGAAPKKRAKLAPPKSPASKSKTTKRAASRSEHR